MTASERTLKNADVPLYALGCTICDDDTSGIAEAEKLAEESDLVIWRWAVLQAALRAQSLTRTARQSSVRNYRWIAARGVDTSDVRLPGAQNELANAVFESGKPVVTVLISGRRMLSPKSRKKAMRCCGRSIRARGAHGHCGSFERRGRSVRLPAGFCAAHNGTTAGVLQRPRFPTM